MVIMNNKGQALVEFVIILPIFIFMILATIDIGKILYFSNRIESKMDDIITMYQNNEDYNTISQNLNSDIKNSSLKISEDDKYIEFKINKEVEIITPGLNLIFKNPYKITVKRVIYNE
jgi:predicted Holliday junction resolvase-like endonuclease